MDGVAESASELVWKLRGQNPPAESVLQRLYTLCPRFRISWTPATEQRSGLWWIHESRPRTALDQRRRLAGRAKLERAQKWYPSARERRRAELWDAEAMAEGLYYVGDYSPALFGTEQMFAELIEGQRLVQMERHRAMVEAGRETEAQADIDAEEAENPAFRDYVRGVAEEWYPWVSGRRAATVTVDKPNTQETTT